MTSQRVKLQSHRRPVHHHVHGIVTPDDEASSRAYGTHLIALSAQSQTTSARLRPANPVNGPQTGWDRATVVRSVASVSFTQQMWTLLTRSLASFIGWCYCWRATDADTHVTKADEYWMNAAQPQSSCSCWWWSLRKFQILIGDIQTNKQTNSLLNGGQMPSR